MKSSTAKTRRAAKVPSHPKPTARGIDRPPLPLRYRDQEGVQGLFQPGAYRSSHRSSFSAAQKPTPACNVVRGFSTSHIPIVHTGISEPRPLTIGPIPESPQAKHYRKQQATIALGGSSSCDDSLSDRGNTPDVPRQPVPHIKRKVFQVGGSSEEENSLKSAIHSARSGMFPTQKKQTSFSNQFVTRIIPAPAIENEQSEPEAAENYNESAIDDEEEEDDSDWEDSIEKSGKSSIDEKTFFQRVDSKVNLTSRRSLITLMLERNDRQVKLGNGASQSTPAIHQSRPERQGPSFVSSPNNSDDSPLMMKRGTRTAHLKPINEIPRSTAQPILMPSHNTHHHAALSPRTTRRNMLSNELAESLRRQLVWERSQKSSTVNAVLKRRHTSHDVAKLEQSPDHGVVNKDANVKASSCDQYFGPVDRYHTEGW